MPTAQDSQGVERVLNWSPGPPDPRDYQLADHLPFKIGLPPDFVDLDPEFPNDITDQGQTGECTAHGSLNDMEFILKKLGFKVDLYSHKAQYALTRLEGGFPLGTDTGAYVRDTCKVLAKIGAILASMHPDTVDFRSPPTSGAVADAAKRRATKYVAVPVNVDAIKATLAAGYPVIVGFSVPQAFMNVGPDGLVSTDMTLIPNAGHCVIVTGYDDRVTATRGRFKIRNSWGKGWGAQGRAWVTYSWLRQLGADFWTIMEVVGEGGPVPVVPTVTNMVMDIEPGAMLKVGNDIGSSTRVYVAGENGQRVMQSGVRITQTLKDSGLTYVNTLVAQTDNEGFAFFPGYAFKSEHPLAADFHYEFNAPGLFTIRSRGFAVVAATPPPVPPAPTPAYITALKTEFTSPTSGKLSVYYTDPLMNKEVTF